MAGVRDPAGGALVGCGALATGDTLVEKRAVLARARRLWAERGTSDSSLSPRKSLSLVHFPEAHLEKAHEKLGVWER